MDCSSCREVLSAALDDEAAAGERAAASAHLAACVECRVYERQLDALHRRVRVHPSEPVPDLTRAILAARPKPSRRKKALRWVAVAGGAAAAAVATMLVTSAPSSPPLSASPKVEVSDVAVSRGPTGGLAVVSFRVRNLSSSDDAVVSVSSDAADDATLHAVRSVDGRELMQSVDQIALSAGETRDLGDGTSHIMLVDLRESLEPGVRVRIEVEFAHAAPIDVDGVVGA